MILKVNGLVNYSLDLMGKRKLTSGWPQIMMLWMWLTRLVKANVKNLLHDASQHTQVEVFSLPIINPNRQLMGAFVWFTGQSRTHQCALRTLLLDSCLKNKRSVNDSEALK